MEDAGDGSNQQHGKGEAPQSVLDQLADVDPKTGNITPTGDALVPRVAEELKSSDTTPPKSFIDGGPVNSLDTKETTTYVPSIHARGPKGQN